MAKLSETEYNLITNLIQLGLEKITQDASAVLRKVQPKPVKIEEVLPPAE